MLLVHLVRSLLSERKLLRKDKKGFVRLLLRETARSLLFLATYNFCRKFGSCYARHHFGMTGRPSSAVPVCFSSEVLGGLGVLFEPAQRWRFFSLYLFPSWLESLQTFLGKRCYLVPVPFFKVRAA